MTAAPQILSSIERISDALSRDGTIHPVTPFWKGVHSVFYLHPTALILAACVGRGGDKTRDSVIMGIGETLSGQFNIPDGECHYFVHVAENLAEATKTLGIYDEFLNRLGVPHSRTGDTIELQDMRRGIKVLACRIGAVSGYRCFGWTADECAKWSNDGVNPSEEIVASIQSMTITHPEARGRLISSPLATMGYFHGIWSAGDTDDVVTTHAASWVANPGGITEETARKKSRTSPNPDHTFAREFGAVPSGNINAIFSVEIVDRVMEDRRGDEKDVEIISSPLLVTDPSGLSRDRWTFAICKWMRKVLNLREMYVYETVFDPTRGKEIQRRVFEHGQPKLNPDFGKGREPFFVVADIGAFDNATHISASRAVEEIVAFALARGVEHVVSDQYGSFLLDAEFRRRGMYYASVQYTNQRKAEALEWVAQLARTDRLRIERHSEMRKELLEFREKVLPSGAITYAGLRHDDFVSLLMTSALADIDGLFRGSPTQTPPKGSGGRSDFGPGDFTGSGKAA